MAKLDIDGIDYVTSGVKGIWQLPEALIDEILIMQADGLVSIMKKTAEEFGVKRTGEMIASIGRGNVTVKGDDRRIYIKVKGKRTRGETETSNAEIAFVNNYGTRRKAARPFIKKATDKLSLIFDKVVQQKIDDYFNSKNL